MLARVGGLAGRLKRLLRGATHLRRQPADGGIAPAAAPHRLWAIPGWVAAVRTRLFVNAATVGVVVFGALAWLVSAGQTASLDLALAQGLQAVEYPWFASLMMAISELGFAPLSLAVVLGTAGGLWLAGRPIEATLAVVGSGATLLAQPFKLLLGRPRPTDAVLSVASELPDYSFPSGHTLLYVGFYGFLFYLAYTRLRRGRLRTLLLWLLGALILLVGPSRVYLGHHWPSDVLASYALGLAYLVLLVRWYARRTLPSALPAV